MIIMRLVLRLCLKFATKNVRRAKKNQGIFGSPKGKYNSCRS